MPFSTEQWHECHEVDERPPHLVDRRFRGVPIICAERTAVSERTIVRHTIVRHTIVCRAIVDNLRRTHAIVGHLDPGDNPRLRAPSSLLHPHRLSFRRAGRLRRRPSHARAPSVGRRDRRGTRGHRENRKARPRPLPQAPAPRQAHEIRPQPQGAGRARRGEGLRCARYAAAGLPREGTDGAAAGPVQLRPRCDQRLDAGRGLFAFHADGGVEFRERPGMRIDFMTVHRFKGLQADYASLLCCTGGTRGFPSTIPPESLVGLLLPDAERMPDAEERRDGSGDVRTIRCARTPTGPPTSSANTRPASAAA